MEKSEVFSKDYFLTAGESNAEGRMPLTLVAERVIEVATEHANSLGIGYANLIKSNIGWVLSRMSIEMVRYPVINDSYTMETWIESYNRMFSNRNSRCCMVPEGVYAGGTIFIREKATITAHQWP